jgi:two-component system sensor histidine kinase KdpD
MTLSTRSVYGTLFSVAAVGIVTATIFAVRDYVPVLSLGVLYLPAVLVVAVFSGLVFAVAVSVASMLAFNFFFLPPVHTLALRDSENWLALAVYLVTAVVVSELATRSRRRAADAAQREREATFLADVSGILLEAEHVQSRLKDVAAAAAAVLGVREPRIELGSVRRPEPGEAAADLQVGERYVGRLFFAAGRQPPAAVAERVLPALASLLAVALDRERLSRAALEAETLRRSDAIKTAVLRAVSHDLRGDGPGGAVRGCGRQPGRGHPRPRPAGRPRDRRRARAPALEQRADPRALRRRRRAGEGGCARRRRRRLRDQAVRDGRAAGSPAGGRAPHRPGR